MSRLDFCSRLCYNRPMEDKEQSVAEAYTEEVRVQRMVKVLEYQVARGVSIAVACKETGLPESTFHLWNRKGVLAEYLADAKASRVSVIQGQAVLALPEVMEHMISLSTGKKVARGASPIRAAELVLKIAGVSGAGDSRGTGIAPNVNILNLLPQQVVFQVEGGHPAIDDQGRLVVPPEIIEGEVIEVED